MDDFERKYHNYLKILNNEIPYVLWKKHHDFKFDFEHNFVESNSFINIIAILWWICGSMVIPRLEYNLIACIIIFVFWIGTGIFYLVFNNKRTEYIADYFFYRYEYKRIIEERIKRDAQRDIKKILDEMLDKEELSFVDFDEYKFKLQDIRFFYDRCLDKIKYEQFEEK